MAKGKSNTRVQVQKRIKILFWGDAVVETGFARVLHSIAKNLPPIFDIAWIGVNYYGDPHKYPYRIYPAPLGGDVYGINRFNSIAELEKPDVIFILNDAWIQDHLLSAIKNFYTGKTLPKIVTYTPVDAADHDGDWYRHFDIVSTPVAYTQFGYGELIKASPVLEGRLQIIPHGVDTADFYKLPATKEAIKRSFYPDNPSFYDNSFIVLNANRNQPRKKIDITVEAFSIFAKNKPDNVKLYLHMGMTDSHINIDKFTRRFGISERLIVSNTKGGVQTLPIDRLNLIYNATDVGINTGIGEGWGLTNIEHAVTGAPQLLAGHSSLKELYSDCGLLVQPSMKVLLDNIMTTGYLVRPEDVALGLEILYTNKELYDEISKKALEKFTRPEYSWKNIAKTWANIFREK